MILLASASPRRHDLLRATGLPFRVLRPGPEVATPAAPPDLALAHARAKALGAALPTCDGLLLAADTVVAAGEHCLGKPRDRAEASRFLDLLAGCDHEVWTAHAAVEVEQGRILEDRGHTAVERAVVRMRTLTPGERDRYLASGDWKGKAGAYGIQSLAAAFTRLVAGDHDTVVGLTRSVVRRFWEGYAGGGRRP